MRIVFALLFLASVLQVKSRPKSEFKLIQTQNGKNHLVGFEKDEVRNIPQNTKRKIPLDEKIKINSHSNTNPIKTKLKEHREDYQLIAALAAGVGAVVEAIAGAGAGAVAVADGIAEVGAAAELGVAAEGVAETGVDAAAELGLDAAEDPMVQGAWDPAMQTNNEPFQPSNSPGRPTGRFVGDGEPDLPQVRQRQRNPAGRPIRGRQSPGIKPLVDVP